MFRQITYAENVNEDEKTFQKQIIETLFSHAKSSFKTEKLKKTNFNFTKNTNNTDLLIDNANKINYITHITNDKTAKTKE